MRPVTTNYREPAESGAPESDHASILGGRMPLAIDLSNGCGVPAPRRHHQSRERRLHFPGARLTTITDYQQPAVSRH
jgi:hypothetical protein